MKRLNFLYFGLILLLATSCGNSFLSKFSTKNSVDISITLPLEELKKSSPSARAASDTSKNELLINLYVNNETVIEKTVKNLEKAETTVTFPDIPIGATIKATAKLIYNEQEYYGESEEVIVPRNGTTLSLKLKKQKAQNDRFSVTPTEDGNVITIKDIPIGCNLVIYDELYMVFACDKTTQTSYTFTDTYVSKGQEREYYAVIDVNTILPKVKVDSIGGKNPYPLTLQADSDGISITSPYAISKIEREQKKDNDLYVATDIFIHEDNLKTYKDIFVNANESYEYFAIAKWQKLEEGIYYFPHSPVYSITSAGGFGEIDIQNSPKARIDYSDGSLELIEKPQLNLPASINLDTTLVQFYYTTPEGNQYIAYYPVDRLVQYMMLNCFSEELLIGKSLTLDPTTYAISFDVDNPVVHYNIRYLNSKKQFSDMPQTINVTRITQPVTFDFEAVAEPTEQGVQITLTDLPVNGSLEISVYDDIGDKTWCYDVFRGTINSNTITLVDSYVNPNETIEYHICVKNSEYITSRKTVSVTTTNGAGRFKVNPQTATNGVVLSIQNPTSAPYTLNSIIRYQVKQEKIFSTAFYSFLDTEIQNTFTLTDKLVNENEEYLYIGYVKIDYFGDDSMNYSPKFELGTITATSGYGDFSLTNKPKGTISFANSSYPDDILIKLAYETPPSFNTTLPNVDSLEFSYVYLLIPYYDAIARVYPGLTYNIKPAMQGNVSEFNYAKGTTITKADLWNDNKYEIHVEEYPYQDGSNQKTVGFYIEYCNSDNLSDMPEEIVIPQNASNGDGGEFSFNAVPTSNGVKLNIENLPDNTVQFSITSQIPGNSCKPCFDFSNPQSSSYELEDTYVSAGDTIEYFLTVFDSDWQAHSYAKTVTATAGLGYLEINAENVSNGIKISFNDTVKTLTGDNPIEIYRRKNGEEGLGFIAYYNVTNKTSYIDKYVNARESYNYYFSWSINMGEYNYYPVVKETNITATAGNGEFVINNNPVATVNLDSRIVTFDTAPTIGVTLPDGCTFIIDFDYLEGKSSKIPVIRYEGNSTCSIDYWFEDPDFLGNTIVPREYSYTVRINGLDDIDGSYTVQSANAEDLFGEGKMPTEIIMPTE